MRVPPLLPATALFALALLAGCTAPGTPVHKASEVNPQINGALVVSVTTQAAQPQHDVVDFIRKRGTNERRGLSAFGPILMLGTTSDLPQLDWRKGRVIAVQLEPGGYELYTWQITAQSGYATTTVVPSVPPVPCHFTITTGEVLYLGNLHLDALTKRGMLGMPQLAGGATRVSDRRDIDLPIMREQFPTLAQWPVEVVIPHRPGWGSPRGKTSPPRGLSACSAGADAKTHR